MFKLEISKCVLFKTDYCLHFHKHNNVKVRFLFSYIVRALCVLENHVQLYTIQELLNSGATQIQELLDAKELLIL